MSVGFNIREEYCEQFAGAEDINESIPNSSIEILSYEPISTTGEERLVFDLINAPASHANALRRTLISSVPSVAIEIVGICNNTGAMPDEVLCHRLGLIPINADPSLLEFPSSPIDDDSNDPNVVLVFGLHVKGGHGPETSAFSYQDFKEGQLPVTYVGDSGIVKSSHLIWMPLEGQLDVFGQVKPLHEDIPITKILPGQEIHLYARAIKGIGLDHAKYSPVCTAFYRLVPKIEVDQSISRKRKELLVSTCPVHVFDIEESGDIVICDSRKCTTCRECIRSARLSTAVKIGKEANRYEFTVETVGVRTASTLVKEAFQVLKNRCEQLKSAIQEATN